VTAQGVCVDLERNVSGSIEVKRRVVDKNGRRYSDDMVVVTCNAACSIAKRQAIFGVVPLAYVKEVEREARRVAIGDARTLATRRAAAIDYFHKMGVVDQQILDLLEKRSIEDIDLADLERLTGLRTAIRDGDTSIEEAFAKPEAKAGELPTGRTEHRRPRGNGQTAAATPAPEAPVETPPESASPPSPDPGPEAQPTAAAPVPETAPRRDTVAESGLDQDELALADLLSDLHDAIATASTREAMTEIGKRLTQNRDWLGEPKYQELVRLYQTRYREISGGTTRR
jgi:hypothetical protein